MDQTFSAPTIVSKVRAGSGPLGTAQSMARESHTTANWVFWTPGGGVIMFIPAVS